MAEQKLKWRGDELTDDLSLASAAAIDGILDDCVAAARQTTAFRDHTGNLRKSIRKRKARATSRGVTGTFGAFAPHAHLVIKGTQKMEARDFITPVSDRFFGELPDRLAAELEKRS